MEGLSLKDDMGISQMKTSETGKKEKWVHLSRRNRKNRGGKTLNCVMGL